MYKAQWGMAKYSKDVAYAISTRIDACGTYGIVEYTNMTNTKTTDSFEKVISVGNTNPSGHGMNGNVFDSDGLAPTITINKGEGPRITEPAVLRAERTDYGKQMRKSVESGEKKISRHDLTSLQPRTDGITNTLTGVQKDNLLADPLNADEEGLCRPLKAQYYKNGRANFDSKGSFGATGVKVYEPSLQVPEATSKGYAEVPVGGVFDGSYPDSDTRRGRVQDGGKVLPTLTCNAENGLRYYEGYRPENQPRFRIRKLTPRECFRLMGVSDANVDTIQKAGISNCQQYKLAGNSIVVDVLEHIFSKLFIDTASSERQLNLF